ncbi:MAG: peptide deformylase [Acidimicrobiales bacterium]
MATGSHSPSGGSETASPQNVFAAEIKRWRDVRGWSRTALAKQMGYDRSYVSKVESGAERPSREFAFHAEAALRAGGAIRRAFSEYRASHERARLRPTVPSENVEGLGSLVVDHDDATLSYDRGTYRLTQRRRLVNGGAEPISRYLIRISVDRYPDDPERSNDLYSAHPLAWEEIKLRAWHGEGRVEPMEWRVHHDREAFKEVWLIFANDSGRFPLYPGESCWIEYEYTVADEHWGYWFQRAIRLPTRRLSVRLDFPADLEPVVWGLYTSMTAESMPFPTAIERTSLDGRAVFSWATHDPPLHGRYRLEWDFRSRRARERPEPAESPAETMRALGILQRDDPHLHRTPRTFSLPDEADEGRRVLAALRSAAERVSEVHVFGKGLGVAAPQIGIDRAAVIVVPTGLVDAGDGDDLADMAIELLNPRVIEASRETDEQYEGCLSFFDVRGLVPRPLVIHVEHQDLAGRRRITVFERSVARLVAHEIDHLQGELYTDRMRPDSELIPVEQYRGTGRSWVY